MSILVWFRQDLRTADNPALIAAAAAGAVLPLYVIDDRAEGAWPMGAAQRWWLHHSLAALDAQLRAAGSRLIVRTGDAATIIAELAGAHAVQAVYWNRRYEPAALARDIHVREALQTRGVGAQSFSGALLHEPWEIHNHAGKPFQVFTAYWRRCLRDADPPAARAAPRRLRAPRTMPASEPLAALGLIPQLPWYAGMARAWTPGEGGAQARLRRFLDAPVWNYRTTRDVPASPGTSQLSPHLHFGELSARQVWHALERRAQRRGQAPEQWRAHPFLTEIYWREFAYHLLYHYPHTPDAPLRAQFSAFPWEKNRAHLLAWQRGRTGVPMVDAGMRQLWTSGWMHNRVRMIVASFLVKNLLIPWQEGARWFWDTLLDADLANNTLGWQWCAGCGADAAPYFRIFNPVRQGERFDPDGRYVRTWVPELAALPARFVHAPWRAPAPVLRAAGLTLGAHYPRPIVDLGVSRARALEAYQAMREAGNATSAA